jgi:hypothetical protein
VSAIPKAIADLAIRELDPAELEQHIQDCRDLMEAAYARFQDYGDPNDRDAAVQHMHRMNEALRSRWPAVQTQRHAAFERRLDEGVDFFQVAGALDAHARRPA